MTLSTSDWIAIGIAAATIIFSVISWFASAWVTKNALSSQILGFRMNLSPLLELKRIPGGSASLKIEFNGIELPEPVLLSVDIMNIGNRAIEFPPILVEAIGATYIIPINIEDVPPGYEGIWTLERTDAETCAVHLQHINPGQVVKARFFLDEMPKGMPIFKCPMKDLKVTEVKSFEVGPVLSTVLEVLYPSTYAAVKTLLR